MSADTQVPQGHATSYPSHPNDWSSGLDDYLRKNGVAYDKAVPLESGTSCYLWRLEGLQDAEASANGHQKGQPVVIKCADSAPKDQAFPVAANRLSVEVQALQSQAVAEACRQEPSVKVPTVLRTTSNGFIMSWEGETDLRTAYKTDASLDAPSIGARLGRWLGHLHLAGIAVGPDGWKLENEALGKFYAPGGIAEGVVRAATHNSGSEGEMQRIMAALRAPARLRTLTPWDFRPMNTLVRAQEGSAGARPHVSTPELTIVDWELCQYGYPHDDIRMWYAEALVLETKFGERGLLASFLAAYKARTGSQIVDTAFVCKVALNAGILILFIMGTNPGIWDCTEREAAMWKEQSLQYIRAGVGEDVAWLRASPLRTLLE